jgi:TolA-binding protein
MKLLKVLTGLLFLLSLTSTVFALNSGNILVDDFYSRVDSWPGQPGNPGYPPTNPVPPSWPGQPTPPSYPGYPDNPPDSYESPQYLYDSGQRSFSQGNYYNAIQYFRRFIDRYPYEYRMNRVCYLTAESYRKLNDFNNAITFYRKVSSEFPTFSEAHRAAYYIGYCQVKVTNYHGAIYEFKNFISRFPTSSLVDDAWYVMGRTYEKVSDRNNAILAYRQIVYNYSNSNYYNDAVERLNYLQSGNNDNYPIPPEYPPYNPGNDYPNFPPDDYQITDYELYKRGHSALISGNHDKGITYFEELIKRFPWSDYADDAHYWKGVARKEQKHFLAAINEFEKLISKFPGSELYEAAYFDMAESEFEHGRINAGNRTYLAKAANHFSMYQQNFPNSKKAAEALVKAGECHEILGDYSMAKMFFQRTITLYPNSWAANKASEKINGYW